MACVETGKPMAIEDVDLCPPTGREVDATLEAIASCHSDITFTDGGWDGSRPAVYGHEAANSGRAIGANAT